MAPKVTLLEYQADIGQLRQQLDQVEDGLRKTAGTADATNKSLNETGQAAKKNFNEASTAGQKLADTIKVVQTADEKRLKLMNDEKQDLIELKKRRKEAFTPEDISEYNKRIAQTQQRIKVLNDVHNEGAKVSKNFSSSLTELGDAAGKVPGPLGSVASGINTATKAAIRFIATPLGLILAGIALAIAAVREAFTSSEEGQNKFAKIMGVIGVVTGNLRDVLASLGDKIISLFENPKQALEDFGTLLKDQVVNRFMGLLELIPALGTAVKLLFKGKFVEAGKVAFDAVAKITTGVEDATDKLRAAAKATGDFIAETEQEAALIKKISDARAIADKRERALIVAKAEAEAKIADLRLKAREEDKFSFAQRRGFLIEAQQLEKRILDEELAIANARFMAFTQETKFSRSTKERLNEEAELQADLSRKKEASLRTEKILQEQLNSLNHQIAGNRSKLEQAASKERDDIRTAENIKAEKQLDDFLRFYEQHKIEQQTIDQKYFDQWEKDFNEYIAKQNSQQRLEDELLRRKEVRAATERDLARTTLNEIAGLNAAFGDEEIARIQRQTQSELQNKKLTEQQKQAIEAQSNARINEIKRRQAVIAKALAIFDIFLNTQIAITKTLAQLGPVAGPPVAALIAAQGAIQAAAVAAKPIPKFAKGVSSVEGPGTETSDSVPALLSRRERVVTAKRNKQYWEPLEAISKGNLEQYINKNYVIPALHRHEKAQAHGFANKLASSLILQSQFDDTGIQLQLIKSRKNDNKNAKTLTKALRQALRRGDY